MNQPSIPAKSYLRALGILFLLSSFIAWTVRIVFFASLTSGDKPNFLAVLSVLPRAVIFDIAFAIYAFIPFISFYVLAPPQLLRGRSFKIFFNAMAGIFLFALIFDLASEIIFMYEFNARFNFITVDYLVYTGEVIQNIWESYPIVWYLLTIFTIVFLLLRGLKNTLALEAMPTHIWRDKAYVLGTWTFLLAIAFFGINENHLLKNLPDFAAELSKNGPHALFAAYRNNQIDYDRFYSRLDLEEARRVRCQWQKEDFDATTTFANKECSLEKKISDPKPANPLNVVIVSIESMSANFMRAYGNDKNITPNLDRFTKEGLFFSNIYATGTRTVRGLEAIALSVPPTPGQSIVRRPDNEKLFSLASALRPFGYDAQFLYGGHSIFDNMKEFFESNSFEVWDKGDLAPNEIHFANAWGVCDEDLFSLALKQADAKFAKGKKFLQLIMTTSNHRPYTFPAGKINIPSNTGRDGAVKYTDFAIGDFIKRAKSHPWFNNTLFVFVADHDASVAGGEHIMPRDYKIPLIFYSPKHIPAQNLPLMGSQLDLAPTIMGILHFSYKSKFFGHNLLTAKKQRAFLATYQKISYLEGRSLLVLSPVRKTELFSLRAGDLEPEQQMGQIVWDTQPMAEQAISLYQTASLQFASGEMKEFEERKKAAKSE